MAMDPQDMQNWPPWVKIAAQVGVPTLLAGYLLFGLSHDIKAEVAGLHEDVRTHAAVTVSAISRRDSNDTEILAYLRELTRVERVNCVNNAHSAIERGSCLGQER